MLDILKYKTTSIDFFQAQTFIPQLDNKNMYMHLKIKIQNFIFQRYYIALKILNYEYIHEKWRQQFVNPEIIKLFSVILFFFKSIA